MKDKVLVRKWVGQGIVLDPIQRQGPGIFPFVIPPLQLWLGRTVMPAAACGGEGAEGGPWHHLKGIRRGNCAWDTKNALARRDAEYRKRKHVRVKALLCLCGVWDRVGCGRGQIRGRIAVGWVPLGLCFFWPHWTLSGPLSEIYLAPSLRQERDGDLPFVDCV